MQKTRVLKNEHPTIQDHARITTSLPSCLLRTNIRIYNMQQLFAWNREAQIFHVSLFYVALDHFHMLGVIHLTQFY